MIITYTDNDEVTLGDPIALIAYSKDRRHVSMKFTDTLTREEVIDLRARVIDILDRAIRLHTRLQ